MALEEGHAPFLLDPASLKSPPAGGGYETFDGKAKGPFTAHPKIDPTTGEMIFFGYSAQGPFTPFVSIGTADRNGAITRAEMLETPFPSMASSRSSGVLVTPSPIRNRARRPTTRCGCSIPTPR